MNVAGRNVVVTGAIDGESRGTAQAKLTSAGANVQSSLTATTDLLVTGEKVGPKKLAKAVERGIEIVPWEAVWNGAGVPVNGNGGGAASAAPPTAAVRTIAPQLAKAGELPTGGRWLFEVKLDGVRCIATVRNGALAMQSRSGKSEYAEQFPALAAEIAKLPEGVYDGEIISVVDGAHSMQTITHRSGASYVVFDLLECPPQGGAVKDWPLRARRELLKLQLTAAPSLRITISPAFDDGEALLEAVAERGEEGVVAKRIDSRYVEGARNGDWIKVKVRNEQEFAALGFVEGEGAMTGAAGSLLLAVWDPDGETFVYVGRVGTGLDYAWWQQFVDLPRAGRPEVVGLSRSAELKNPVWLAEPVVVQVRFQRWTEDGRLWHPSAVGLRTDKEPHECRREA